MPVCIQNRNWRETVPHLYVFICKQSADFVSHFPHCWPHSSSQFDKWLDLYALITQIDHNLTTAGEEKNESSSDAFFMAILSFMCKNKFYE